MSDDWWQHDGTVDWAVNPAGQIIELTVDDAGWSVTVRSPFAPKRKAITVRSHCEAQARQLYDGLASLSAPRAMQALQQYRRRRAQRDHPAGGGD